MKEYLISDTHFNHAKIATYCQRPADFTSLLVRRWNTTVKPDDVVFHLGDVFIGPVSGWNAIWPHLTGRKILIRGNHDRNRSVGWWMRHGFDAVLDAAIHRRCWLTHEPALALPYGCELNIHGHLHNCWDTPLPYDDELSRGVFTLKSLPSAFNRLFAVEYTNYMPVEFGKFVQRCATDYRATGPLVYERMRPS